MKKNGFTLTEILVVIFIISLLSGIAFVNYREGGRLMALQRAAYRLAQDIRRVQEMAMAAKEFRDKVPQGGYGIAFADGDDKYVIFADCGNISTRGSDCQDYGCYDNNATTTFYTKGGDWGWGTLNPTGGDTFTGTCDGFPEEIEVVSLGEGVTIRLGPQSPHGRARIRFLPPDPTVKINWGICDAGFSPPYCLLLEDAELLTLTISLGEMMKTITVNKAGLIEIR